MRASLVPRGTSVLALGLCLLACSPEGDAPVDAVPLADLDDVDPDVVEAIQAARAVVEREPLSAEAWGKLGNRYFVHDFRVEAARCFVRAEELDPERYVWSYRLGWCLVDDRPEEAAQAFERSLRGLDDYAPALEIYAHTLELLGRTDEAIELLTRASSIDPASPHADTGLGQILLARGEFEAAREHFERALVRDERHGEAHAGIAQVYLALSMEEEARQHAEISRTLPQESPRQDWLGTPELPPAGAKARTKLGRQLVRQGRLDEAAEQYRLALKANPDYYQARLSLAELLIEQGKRDEARELLREAQELDPAHQQVRLDLARLFDEAPQPK